MRSPAARGGLEATRYPGAAPVRGEDRGGAGGRGDAASPPYNPSPSQAHPGDPSQPEPPVRLPSRVALLIAAALGVFAGVVAIQLYRLEIVRASCARPRAEVPAERPPAAILAAAGSPAERGVAASRTAPVDPPRPSRSTLTIRVEHDAIDVNVLQRAAFHLKVLGSDGVEGSILGWATRDGEASEVSDSWGASAVMTADLARTDVRISGLPVGPVRALVVLRVDRTVVGIAGPISIGADVIEASLDMVPADRLGSVVVDVRRDGAAFGPAVAVVRAGGLTVESGNGVHGRGAPMRAPVGIPLEVSLAWAPGHEELGLPPPQELTLAPRETRDVVFALDDGVPFRSAPSAPTGGRSPSVPSSSATSRGGARAPPPASSSRTASPWSTPDGGRWGSSRCS